MKFKRLKHFWALRISTEQFQWKKIKNSLNLPLKALFIWPPVPTSLPNRLALLKKFNSNKLIKLRNTALKFFFGPYQVYSFTRVRILNTFFLENSFTFISIRNILNRKMFSWLFLNLSSTPPLSLYFKNFIIKKHMQKLKFKPGYIILWKKIRLILMQWIGVKFPYPTRFTRFLLKVRYPAILTPLYQYSISIYNFLFRILPFQFSYVSTSVTQTFKIRVNAHRVQNPQFLLVPYDWVQVSYNYIYFWVFPLFLLQHIKFLKKFWKLFAFFWNKANFEKRKIPRRLARFFAYTKLFPQTVIYYESSFKTGLYYFLPLQKTNTQFYYEISPISWTMYNWKYIT